MYRIPYENEQITKTIAAPYAPVDFTEEEKGQFRENIGAGSGSGGGRNLLDNPFFTVNQRGLNTYPTESGYCVDRWLRGSGITSITTNPLTINVPSGASFSTSYFYQKIENDRIDTSKEYTFSMIVNNELYSVVGKFLIDNGTNKYSLGTDFEIWFNTSSGFKYVAIYFKNFKSYVIKAVKLELGSVSTLANDSAPNYATELLKCQRYFQVYKIAGKNDVMDVAFAWSATIAYLSMQAPVVFRTTPTASFKNTRLSNANSNNYPITSIGVNTANSNAITLVLNTSGLTPGAMYLVRSDGTAQATIELSADL